jgi:hypothetical protein
MHSPLVRRQRFICCPSFLAMGPQERPRSFRSATHETAISECRSQRFGSLLDVGSQVRLGAVCCGAWCNLEESSVECVDDSIVTNPMRSWYLHLFNHSGQFPPIARCNHFHRDLGLSGRRLPGQLNQTNSRARRGTVAAASGDSEFKHENFQSEFG